MTQGTERSYLVLIVGMLVGPGPAAELYHLSKTRPSSFHLLVPATKPDYGLTWTDEQALSDAKQRLEIMLEFGTAMGMQVSGDVARTDEPVDAARDAADGFDEMIVIDNPHGLQRWRSEKELDKLAADPGLPLRHFRANPPHKQGKQFDTAELRVDFQRFLAELKRSEGALTSAPTKRDQ